MSHYLLLFLGLALPALAACGDEENVTTTPAPPAAQNTPLMEKDYSDELAALQREFAELNRELSKYQTEAVRLRVAEAGEAALAENDQKMKAARARLDQVLVKIAQLKSNIHITVDTD